MSMIARFQQWACRPLRQFQGTGSMALVYSPGDALFSALDEETGAVPDEELIARGWQPPLADEDAYDHPLPVLPILGVLPAHEADHLLSGDGGVDVLNLLIEMPCGTNLYGADYVIHGHRAPGRWLVARVELSQPSGFGPCDYATLHIGLVRQEDGAVFAALPDDRAGILAVTGVPEAALGAHEVIAESGALGG